MIPQAAAQPFVSVEDYLAGEQDGQMRHEYIDGIVHAMTGASRRHGLICMNLAVKLRPLLNHTPCQLFANDMKVRLEIHGKTLFYYPDLVLTCDPDDREDYFTTRPRLIVEVLSPHTERFDRREKLLSYITLPSLQEYLLVAQDEPRIEVYRRTQDWLPDEYTDGTFPLACVNAEIAVAAVYEGVFLARDGVAM
ncbi:Uma2 family endonuclease [Halothiobacillus sp. DCM-1]|uniref:Uma2 family endonuclease n=1 Tax=Halothiobacillus sp. DCM-1 TaxID=3112558 RepID=UPI00324BA88F